MAGLLDAQLAVGAAVDGAHGALEAPAAPAAFFDGAAAARAGDGLVGLVGFGAHEADVVDLEERVPFGFDGEGGGEEGEEGEEEGLEAHCWWWFCVLFDWVWRTRKMFPDWGDGRWIQQTR